MIAANTVWVVVAAVLVTFMQAGFAFLEAGLTRMKNAAHVAGEDRAHLRRLLARLLGGWLRACVRRRGALVGTSGFLPGIDELVAVGEAPFSFFASVPAAAGYLFEVVFPASRSRSSGGDG